LRRAKGFYAKTGEVLRQGSLGWWKNDAGQGVREKSARGAIDRIQEIAGTARGKRAATILGTVDVSARELQGKLSRPGRSRVARNASS
jgi:hypothetical protein